MRTSIQIHPGGTNLPVAPLDPLGRNHEVHRLRAFAFLVRFDLEGDTLSFDQILQSCSFDRGDVDEHVAAAIIGLDEAIAAFSVEELDRTSHGHRETPPRTAPPSTRTARDDPTGFAAGR